MSGLIRPRAPIPTPIDPIQVKIYDEGYKGVTVDSSVTPLENIIQYVEGSVWEVEYYSQVLDSDSEPQPAQPGMAPAYQQYTQVKGLELKVTSPLAISHDNESGSNIAEGTAYIPMAIIPNKGDHFFADIGQGREAMLTVTSVERKTHYKQSVYLINYEVVQFIDHEVSKEREDVQSKVIKTVHYVRDHAYFGVNPLMLSADFNARIDMQKLYNDLVHHYFNDFYSYGYQTLLIPDQPQPCYDPFLTQELLKWVDVNDAPNILKINKPRVTTGFGRIPDTVWSAITAADYGILRNAVHRAGLVHRSYFRTLPDLGGFFYTGVDYCMYPDERRTDVDKNYRVDCEPASATALAIGRMRFDDLRRLNQYTPVSGLNYPTDPVTPPPLPNIAEVSLSGYYIFSEGFYLGQGPLASNLERLIYQQLKHDTIDAQLLVTVANEAMAWDNLERFYYIPALLALLKTAIRIN